MGTRVRRLESESLNKVYNQHNKGQVSHWEIHPTSGHGFNCLIDAIAQSLGLHTSPQEREEIRRKWIEDYPGLQLLPNDQSVLYRILLALGVEEPHSVGVTFFANNGEIDNLTWNPSTKTRTIFVYHKDGHYESLQPL